MIMLAVFSTAKIKKKSISSYLSFSDLISDKLPFGLDLIKVFSYLIEIMH